MNWEIVIVIILAVVAVIASGKLVLLKKEISDLVTIFNDARSDGTISEAEWTSIFKEADDVLAALREIATLAVQKRSA